MIDLPKAKGDPRTMAPLHQTAGHLARMDAWIAMDGWMDVERELGRLASMNISPMFKQPEELLHCQDLDPIFFVATSEANGLQMISNALVLSSSRSVMIWAIELHGVRS